MDETRFFIIESQRHATEVDAPIVKLTFVICHRRPEPTLLVSYRALGWTVYIQINILINWADNDDIDGSERTDQPSDI